MVNIHEVTEFGTILTETTLGHIKVIRNCCGKIITKCLEFVDDTDSGVDQWYVLKKDKNIQSIILKPVLVQQIQNKYQLLV